MGRRFPAPDTARRNHRALASLKRPTYVWKSTKRSPPTLLRTLHDQLLLDKLARTSSASFSSSSCKNLSTKSGLVFLCFFYAKGYSIATEANILIRALGMGRSYQDQIDDKDVTLLA